MGGGAAPQGHRVEEVALAVLEAPAGRRTDGEAATTLHPEFVGPIFSRKPSTTTVVFFL